MGEGLYRSVTVASQPIMFNDEEPNPLDGHKTVDVNIVF